MLRSPPSSSAIASYKRINVETSAPTMDKHQIVKLLYDGLLENLMVARGALERGDVAAKGQAIGKAVRIIEEGLMTGLDRIDGGEIAANLHTVYQYCSKQLTLANLRNDDALIREVQALIEPIAQSWGTIKSGGVAASVVAAEADAKAGENRK